MHRRGGKHAGAADARAEQGALVVAGDAGGADVFVEERFELVMRRGCINKGEDASDPAVLKEWADRDGIKRATKEVREARAYHEASPAGKIKMRIGWAR